MWPLQVLQAQKKRYVEWVKARPELPFQYHPAWLDVVCGPDHWSAVVEGPECRPYGLWPFWYRPRWKGMLVEMKMPPYTPQLGPLLDLPPQKRRASGYALEHKVLASLLEKLPAADVINHNLHYTCQNALPFAWAGFHQRMRYSYWVDVEEADPETLRRSFSEGKRQEVRRGLKNGLQWDDGVSLEAFIQLHLRDLYIRGAAPAYTPELLSNMTRAMRAIGDCWICGARSAEGHLLAAHVLMVQPRQTCNLMMALSPEGRKMGAPAWLIWQILVALRGHTRTFDFEGSVQPAIERSYRQYGGYRKAFLQVEKNQHLLYRLRRAVRIIKGKSFAF